MGAIYLVRHGQASFGQANYDQLSPLGFEQARVVGEHLKGRIENVDAVFLGTMRRHRETANTAVTAMGLGLPLHEDAGFNEYAFEAIVKAHRPDFHDQSVMKAELAKGGDHKKAFQLFFEAAVARWIGGEHDHEYEESWPQFHSRCGGALDHLVQHLGHGKTAVVFTSGGFIGVTVQRLLGLTAKQAFGFNWHIANASITKLLYGSRGISLQSFNEHGHLEQAQGRLLTFR